MKFRQLLLIPLLFLLFISCDKDETTVKGVFPLTEGNSWVLKNTEKYTNASPRNTPLPPDDSVQVSNELEKIVQLSNGESAYENNSIVSQNSEVVSGMRTYYQERGDGLYVVATGSFTNTKNKSNIDFSVWIGDKNFSSIDQLKNYLLGISGIYRSKSDSIQMIEPPQLVFKYPLKEGLTWVYVVDGSLKIEKSVIGKENFTTPAGTFDCWVMKWKYYINGYPYSDILMIEYLSEEGIIGQIFTYTHMQIYNGDYPVYADYEEKSILQSYNLVTSSENPVK